MKRTSLSQTAIASLIILSLFFFSCVKEQALPEKELEKRESIFDRVVHIEPELIKKSEKIIFR